MSKSKRVLIFDGQVFQTPALHRGMGKYSLELIESLVIYNKTHNVWDEVQIILSTELDTDRDFLATINDRLKGVRVVELGLSPNEFDNRPTASHNRQIMDRHAHSYLEKDDECVIDFMVLSLMQSEVAPAFPSSDRVNNVLLFYDLIPLMFHETYLTDALNQKGYLTKIAELLRADTYLAISKTVANDLSFFLGISPQRIVSIDGAPIRHGNVAEKIDVPAPFILMPTGNDLRKNNKRAIQAFQKFNERNGLKYHLVVTSSFQDHEIKEYQKMSDKIIFTGNISGGELEFLYQETDVLLFPSEYEGLGLPILEALEKNKIVVCSDIPVFREISTTAFLYVDPLNVDSIADGLDKAVAGYKYPKNEYERILRAYSWSSVASIATHAIVSKRTAKKTENKPAIDIFMSDPAISMLAATWQQQHSELSKVTTPRYYVQRAQEKNTNGYNYLSFACQKRSLGDACDGTNIYLIEDDKSCSEVLLIALSAPGILVLKDVMLSELWQSVVREGFVDPSRGEIEKRLDNLYGVDGVSGVVSLISAQKVVVVYDKNSRRLIKTVLKNIDNNTTHVECLDYPTSELTYCGPIVSEREGVLSLGGEAADNTIEASAVIDSFSAMQHITRFSFVRVNNFSYRQTPQILKILSLGLRLVIDNSSSDNDSPKRILNFAVTSFQAADNTSVRDYEEVRQTFEDTTRIISKHNSFKLHADNLSRLVNIIQPKIEEEARE